MSFQVSLQRVRPLQRRSGSRGMQVTHGGFHCEVGTKRSGNAVKQNRLLEDESLQEDGIFFKRRINLS